MRVVGRWSLRRGILGILSILLALSVAPAEILYQVRSLGVIPSGGRSPQSRLLVGPDGTLYGTTYQGGHSDRGTIFAMNPDGSEFRYLHEFTVANDDGARPYADLVFDSNRLIYGTTEQGGTNDGGTLFRMRRDGSDYEVLFRFNSTVGYWPRGHLLRGPDGFFYSTTQRGGIGTGQGGTVYRIRPDGTGFAVLHAFGGTTPQGIDGFDCDTGLTLGSDGLLYGVSSTGGNFASGTVFKLTPDGTEYTLLHHFDGTNGWEPDGRLLELSNGKLYGTTQFGGSGTIYTINKDGSEFEVLRFMGGTNGEPGIFLSGLILGGDGALYGSLFDGIIKIQPDGSGFQVLHRFVNPSVGDGLMGFGLSVGTGGVLYGVTSAGGAYRQGTVFKINTDATDYSILHHFQHQGPGVVLPRARLLQSESGVFFGTSESGGPTNAGTVFSIRANGSDGRLLFRFGMGTNAAKIPNGLCEGGDGFLYGTTLQGGNSNVGTIFRIDQNGSNYSVIRHFGATGEPRSPRGGLTKGADGWLYGTSFSGGTANRGSIYKVNKETGDLVVLRSPSVVDGQQPQCELVQDSAGSLYGTAVIGGAQNFGTVFRIEPDESDYTVLHNFTGGAAGQNPMSGVMIASDGRLYGTTSRQLGSFAGCVYRLETGGSGFQVLKSFPNTGSDPKLPRPVLVEAPDGLLYGSTQLGGAANKGIMFRIHKDGDGFAVLHEFGASVADGQTPSAAFTVVGDGSFLGVTEAGGDGNGTIFRFDPADVRLRIGLTPTSAELHWSASSTVDTLELTSGVSGFDWQPSGVGVSRQGDENHVTVPRQPSGQFYRVQRVWP